MLKQKLQTWGNLSELMKRATATFEKKSGWKTKEVRSTLDKFSALGSVNKVLLGGLLVGEAVLGKTSKAPIKRQPKKTAPVATSIN